MTKPTQKERRQTDPSKKVDKASKKNKRVLKREVSTIKFFPQKKKQQTTKKAHRQAVYPPDRTAVLRLLGGRRGRAPIRTWGACSEKKGTSRDKQKADGRGGGKGIRQLRKKQKAVRAKGRGGPGGREKNGGEGRIVRNVESPIGGIRKAGASRKSPEKNRETRTKPNGQRGGPRRKGKKGSPAVRPKSQKLTKR